MHIQLTAATLRAILCYIDSGVTPQIAYDKDEYAKPLIKKIRDSVGSYGGSQTVTIDFKDGEEELQRQFCGVCTNITYILESIIAIMRFKDE